jgi:hypothetical protein
MLSLVYEIFVLFSDKKNEKKVIFFRVARQIVCQAKFLKIYFQYKMLKRMQIHKV